MNRGGPRISVRGRGGDRRSFPQRAVGPPDQIIEIGSFIHAVEDEMFCSSLLADRVPHFNAPVYLQNKSMIGKIDEILGPINEVYFSVKMSEGMVASSFKRGDIVYIGGDKLLPIERFLPKPKPSVGSIAKRGRGRHDITFSRGGRGGGRGRGNFQRGGFRNVRGNIRGNTAERSRGFGGRGRGGRGRGGFRG
ncbi:hypothetical protein APHAL10511_001384 [Amanita phalloides]|nr:hypothetical protein APHAL10511_001384 [Amanita phalloides]